MSGLPYTREEIAEVLELSTTLRSHTKTAAVLSKRWGINVSKHAVRGLVIRERQAGRYANPRRAAIPDPVPAAAPSRRKPPPAPAKAPAVHTSKSRRESYLIISDTQAPYEAPAALQFARAVAKEFGVDIKTPGRVYHVGDEVDFQNFSRFLRSPEIPHTPNQEIEAVRASLREWYAAFPHVRLCQSNHGDRILRRAAEVGLPTQLLRAHRDVLEAPAGWEWAREWNVAASAQPFLVEHGHHGGQSTAAARQRPAMNGMSTTWGHMHAQAGVWHVRTHRQEVWGMCVGSLIDREAVAFEYGRPNTWQPWLGVGVVLDGGRVPLLVPYGGQWP